MSTYNRKFYLIRKIKASGFNFEKRNNERLILVPLNRVQEAYNNPDITELQRDYNYGLQIGNYQHYQSTTTATVKLAAPVARKSNWLARKILKVARQIVKALEK